MPANVMMTVRAKRKKGVFMAKDDKGFFQMRLTDEDVELFDELTEVYGVSRSALVRHALRFIAENKPTLEYVRQIAPQGKASALATALHAN